MFPIFSHMCEKEEIKCNSLIKNEKMFNFNYVTKEDIKGHNANWSQILDLPYRIVLIGGSGSAKTNMLLNLIDKPYPDKIYLYAEAPYEAKYQLLINIREDAGLKHWNDSKDFMEYSNSI